MNYKLFLISLLLPLLVSCQSSNTLFDGKNAKRFTKFYQKPPKYDKDLEVSANKVKNVIKGYVDKYNINLNVPDTIYIVESFILEEMRHYGSLWNNKKHIDYIYYENKKKFRLKKHKEFHESEIKLVKDWDLKGMEEREGGKYLLPAYDRMATRVIINNNDIVVERALFYYAPAYFKRD